MKAAFLSMDFEGTLYPQAVRTFLDPNEYKHQQGAFQKCQ